MKRTTWPILLIWARSIYVTKLATCFFLMLYADSPRDPVRKSYRPSPDAPLALLRSVFHTNASVPVTPQDLSSRRRGVLTAVLLVLFIAGCAAAFRECRQMWSSLAVPSQ